MLVDLEGKHLQARKAIEAGTHMEPEGVDTHMVLELNNIQPEGSNNHAAR